MIIDQLLQSPDPIVRYLTRVQVLGDQATSRAAQRERRLIPQSPIAAKLLAHLDQNVYAKWTGPHWVLAFLSELGYPPGGRKLRPLADRCAKWALGMRGTLIDGRWRRCGSQQGYAILYLMKLGFYDERCDELIDRLIMWQWPDGGWNCDKNPEARHSSFHESWLPMRALFHFAAHTGRSNALRAARKAAKLFLDRKLFRRKTTGDVIDPRFLSFNYPYHWRYNLLVGLKAMAEANLIGDRRCREDVLRRKQMRDGGFAAKREHQVGVRKAHPNTPADFGPYDRRANPFVTIDALYVLRQAGDRRDCGG